MTDDAPWTLRFESRAEKDMRRLDPPMARRVIEALERLLARDPSLDLRRLQGRDEWRLRRPCPAARSPGYRHPLLGYLGELAPGSAQSG